MGLFTAALGRDLNRRFLVVERLPDGGWDWAAWHRDAAGLSRHGVAPSAATAMEAAERAAVLLTLGHGLFRAGHSRALQSVQGKPS